jgi:regulator of replication initiation timing
MGVRARAAAGAAIALAAVCGLVATRGGDVDRRGGRVALLELGEESKDDLRKALALEVSKKRFNKAQKKLEGLHTTMEEDFVQLKKWAIEKAEARAQLEKVIAENDPSMSIDESSTSEYSAPSSSSLAHSGFSSGLAHLSTSKHAKVARAARLSEEAPVAAAKARGAKADTAREKKFKGELSEMIKEQTTTQSEVAELATQMKSMMTNQAQLNKEMTNAVSRMAQKDAMPRKSTGKAGAAARPMPSVIHSLAVAPSDADMMSFQNSESDSIHKILQRELSRLNLDRPKSVEAAMAVEGKAHAEARLRSKSARLQASGGEAMRSARREMEAAILASRRLGTSL